MKVSHARTEALSDVHAHNQSNRLTAVWHQLSASLSLYLSSQIYIPFPPPLSHALLLPFLTSSTGGKSCAVTATGDLEQATFCLFSYSVTFVLYCPLCLSPVSFSLSPFFKAIDDMISDPQLLFPPFLFSALLQRESNFKRLKRWCLVNYCTSIAQCSEGVAEYFGYFSRSMVYLVCGKQKQKNLLSYIISGCVRGKDLRVFREKRTEIF